MTRISKKAESKATKTRIYFSKETERRVFFYMTLLMLAAGGISKLF
ncbi:MAG: hypothetical protein MI799_09990 [Desulfobacterales bacterium]|nr:hypothetical protein [Desulfobacterales bacterium]